MNDQHSSRPINQPDIDHDRLISGLVQSVRFQLPASVNQQVTQAIDNHKTSMKEKQQTFLSRFPFPRLRPALVTIAFLFFITIAGLLVFYPILFPSHNNPAGISTSLEKVPIDEIKTEFEISNKNIRILWVQKQNFKLRRNE